jgi:Flagellar hook-basal body protein
MDISAISGIGAGINPINAIGPLVNDGTSNSVSSADGTSLFSDLYSSLIDSANATNNAFEGDIVKAAEGELDNPQQLTIDSTKANIAFQLVSNVRTQALEAYNEVIKMSV